jgi:hypothetical protein
MSMIWIGGNQTKGNIMDVTYKGSPVTILIDPVYASHTGELTVPVKVTNLPSICAYEAALKTDGNVLDITKYNNAGSLTDGFMSAFNNSVAPYSKAQVMIAAANATNVEGTGVFFSLTINCKVPQATTNIDIIYLCLNEDVVFGEKPNPTPVPPLPEPAPQPVPTVPVVIEQPVPPPAPTPAPQPIVSSISEVYRNMPDGTQKLWGYQFYHVVNGSMTFIRDIAVPANNKEDAEEWNALTGMNIPVPTNSRYDPPPQTTAQLAAIQASLDALQSGK